MRKIQFPLSREDARSLRAGDSVSLTGPLYTARDAAHKRLAQRIDEGGALPIDLTGQTLYYVGPTPAKPGKIVGSAGPTTSSRMDVYTERLLSLGLRGMIGKGKRSPAVIRAMQAAGAVYFGATGGAAALISRSILSARIVCYGDLGAEAIHLLEVADFPAVVLIDSNGNNLYEIGPDAYRN